MQAPLGHSAAPSGGSGMALPRPFGSTAPHAPASPSSPPLPAVPLLVLESDELQARNRPKAGIARFNAIEGGRTPVRCQGAGHHSGNGEQARERERKIPWELRPPVGASLSNSLGRAGGACRTHKPGLERRTDELLGVLEIMNEEPRSRAAWNPFSAGLFPLIGAGISLYIALCLRAPSEGPAPPLASVLAGLLRPLGLVVLLQTAYTALQSILWMRYRPFVAPPAAELPVVSVIIPAFNEGPMVENSIRSVVLSDYPAEKLEIIVVDDGSRDDTFFHMRHLRREFPQHVRLLRFGGNRGKRAALREGFKAARGEIVVTIDSDSQVTPQTVREMVAPFLADARVGAVAGRVAVLNRDSFISRMLEVQYALAFDFGRAAQSVYRAVACCPGALSAFRTAIILPHLEDWTRQRFLGRPVNHGEDQALTNIVLRSGFDTVYQSTAVVHTLAPSRYRQLSKMFVRWDRSYIVEGFSFAKFMFTPYRRSNRALPVVAFLLSTLRLVAVFNMVVGLPALFATSLPELLRASAALLVGTAFTALYYLRIERSFRFLYGVAYAVYSVVCLQWILPWAILTVRDERWGTR